MTFKLTAVILASLLCLACQAANNTDELSEYGKIFSGSHKLLRIDLSKSGQAMPNSGFAIPGPNGYTFAWQMRDQTFAFSTLPIQKVRLNFDENATEPTVKFRWIPGSGSSGQLQSVIDAAIVYALISIRKNDWQSQANLPPN